MIDLKMDDNGDLVLSDKGDLALVFGDEQIAQEVLFRLKTTAGDWTLSPQIGASLEDFIGEPNTEYTLAAIENRVEKALTFDSLLIGPEITAITIGPNEVLVVVEFGSIELDNRVIQVTSGLDLQKGVVFARTAVRELQ